MRHTLAAVLITALYGFVSLPTPAAVRRPVVPSPSPAAETQAANSPATDPDRKLKTPEAPASKKFEAQMAQMAQARKNRDADKLLAILFTIKPENSTETFLLQNSALDYVRDVIAPLKGVDVAVGAYDYIEKSRIADSDPEEEEIWRIGIVDPKFRLLLDHGRKDAALQAMDAYIASLTPNGRAKRLATTEKTRLPLRGGPAPAIHIERSYNSDIKSLADLKGKVVVVDFFAHWCIPCIASFPAMHRMYDDLKGQGLEILSVTKYYGYFGAKQADTKSMDPDTEYAKMAGLIKKHKVTWPVLYGGDASLVDYGVGGLPTSFVIDRKGNIVEIEDEGYVPEEFPKFRKKIEALLKARV